MLVAMVISMLVAMVPVLGSQTLSGAVFEPLQALGVGNRVTTLSGVGSGLAVLPELSSSPAPVSPDPSPPPASSAGGPAGTRAGCGAVGVDDPAGDPVDAWVDVEPTGDSIGGAVNGVVLA